MIQRIRTSRISKIVASYLALQLIITVVQPLSVYALTSGPSQPEFNSFTPIGTSDMVSLSSGDFNYNIPIMDVGGYPLNLAYDSGITMDQEASWVGLGWNLNVGQIARQVRGLPDDFKGDLMTYENDMRPNSTVGVNVQGKLSFFGFPDDIAPGGNYGLGVQYNNYEGISFHPSFGTSFSISESVQVGLNLSSSTTGGASVSPSVSFFDQRDKEDNNSLGLGSSVGISLSSRKGLESLSVSASVDKKQKVKGQEKEQVYGYGQSGTISFDDTYTHTPFKRAGTVSGNFSFNAAIGSETVGVEVQGHILGYGSTQSIRSEEREKQVPSYGYNFTQFADKGNSVLDFNREKDRTFNKNTTVLPMANHTYDIYSIQGQGISGMFRPHRGQVSYLMDNKVQDYGDGVSAGVEFGAGWNVHTGADIKISPSYSYTAGWRDGNYALNRFEESAGDNDALSYEPVYYKKVGELNVDPQPALYQDRVSSDAAIRIGMGGARFNRTLVPTFEVKKYNNGVISYDPETIGSKIKREGRDRRNTAIYTVTGKEAAIDSFVIANDFKKDHHTAGFKTMQSDGSTYVYGQTAYNTDKKEITVDLSGTNDIDYSEGTIAYNGGVNGKSGSDEYLNIIHTPAYAHTYLLSSILSKDYEDIGGDGPSLDDLGSYTQFNYGEDADHYVGNFNWRIPYESDRASYNEGLKSHSADQKGNVISGSKELKYIQTITTKTHVAYFKLSDRRDGLQSGGGKHMKKIDKIFLLTQPEYQELLEATDNNKPEEILEDSLLKESIKVAHFVYAYDLCQGIPNRVSGTTTTNELSNDGGKLTLKEVYFTYRGSNMGKYTPYLFHYDGFNPPYNLKGYDIWGNFKENEATGNGINSPLTPMEYPFVEQDKAVADQNTGAWMLSSISLPSGGELEITTESDDYQYVQDRKAMQMFKIKGFGGQNPASSSNNLYAGGIHTEYIHVKISDEDLDGQVDDGTYDGSDFLSDYLSENAHKPIYFRALLNMVKNTNTKYDYVSGYFEVPDNSQGSDFGISATASGTYVAIPLKMLDLEGGLNGGQDVNPIAKAGWYFGRTYLNRVVYSLGGDYNNTNFSSIINDLVSSFGAIFEIFSGPNGKLQEKQCARTIIPDKSWVRLENPSGRKFGGGVRVKEIKLHDNWDQMLSTGNPIYKQFYGQQYSYELEDGTSSGVATFEPNGSQENPFVEPFYDRGDKLVAPKESNYTEKPFGASFFPAPTVTYGTVTVNNLEREDGVQVVNKHATGRVVHEFYTSRDFPTKTDHTALNGALDDPGPLTNILNLSVKQHLTFTQGFVVETNDMNGRQKSQRVYPQGQQAMISGVDYTYRTKDGGLSNEVMTIDNKGQVSNSEVGLTYDVYNDFRESYSESTTVGVDFNVAAFVIFIVPVIVPLPIPDYAYHETKLRTASTTKVIHRSAIMEEKVAYDLGSQVSTKNLAWDANTGEVLLSETVNEYDDAYYSFSYPAHWYYKGMDRATKNIGITGTLEKQENAHDFTLSGSGGESLEEVFTLGDELFTYDQDGVFDQHLWVAQIESNNLLLVNSEGEFYNDECEKLTLDFKIVRSGYRNQQTATMGSVTSMVNPIFEPDPNGGEGTMIPLTASTFAYDGVGVDPRVVNASAVAYKEAWALQWENNLPKFPEDLKEDFNAMGYDNEDTVSPYDYGFNPYLYNVRGEWRAKESFAYLTGRQSTPYQSASPRYEGYFEGFMPFYAPSPNGNGWEIPVDPSAVAQSWTSASTVSQYSPYGAEVENRDALNRYSSAQYGYAYTLPVAVSSNSQYREMGFDGFEDYRYQSQQKEDGHFIAFDTINGQAGLNHQVSHTGRSSMAVTGQTSYLLDYTDDGDYQVDPHETDDCNNDPPPDCPFEDTIELSVGLSGGGGPNNTDHIFTYPMVFGNVDVDIDYVIPEPNPNGCIKYNEHYNNANPKRIEFEEVCNDINSVSAFKVYLTPETLPEGCENPIKLTIDISN